MPVWQWICYNQGGSRYGGQHLLVLFESQQFARQVQHVLPVSWFLHVWKRRFGKFEGITARMESKESDPLISVCPGLL